MTTFSVAPQSKSEPLATSTVVLEQDRWDDFGYKTQYSLYYFGETYKGLIGGVKILRIGQRETSTSVLQVGPLKPLTEEFCSLGQSLDYYERLAELPAPARGDILNALHDALAHPDHAKLFEQEPGWRVSVNRDVDPSFKPLALVLLERGYSSLVSMGINLSFQINGWKAPLKLDFAAPSAAGPISTSGIRRMAGLKQKLPERIAVITGLNGSGKSTLLARLARVLHASQAARRQPELLRLGSIEPPGIGFTRVIAIGYSAFDTFQVPGVDIAERKQLIADLRSGMGRYAFCGLRDIARELEERLDRTGGDAKQASSDADAVFSQDRLESTYLKSADQLADEYERTVSNIFKNGRSELLSEVLTILLTDPSFAEYSSPSELLEQDARGRFMRWSTGHKIVTHALTTLVDRVQPKSIVLMDEPESHLHPPLLATLMHAVRHVLDEQDSFAVIATHSPVVAQETLGRHVSVVRRNGDVVSIHPPKVETYGESIGEISNEVFGLHADATDYHKVLRGIVDRGLSLEQIESLFERGLSLQARAYVMSLIASRAP